MQNTNLPETYRGYPTRELLAICRAIPCGVLNRHKHTSEKTRALREFIMEYDIDPLKHPL